MPKIMLVEDDNNLREIYGERLTAEGYDIVSAGDGEEALAMAVKEKPDLIIADVMMPKISGFDMLDILRQTPETKDTKVIIMTALSQAEDKTRAGTLGADKYLVKSQVTLEDVARVVHDLLEGKGSTPAAAPVEGTMPDPPAAPPADPPAPDPLATDPPADPPSTTTDAPLAQPPAEPADQTLAQPPAPEPQVSESTPPMEPAPTDESSLKSAESTSQEKSEVDDQIRKFEATKPPEEPEHVAPLMEPSAGPAPAEPQVTKIPVIQPLDENSPHRPKDINQLYQEELAKEEAQKSQAAGNPPADPAPQPAPESTAADTQPPANAPTDHHDQIAL